MGPVGVLFVLALLIFFPRLSSLLCRLAGAVFVLIAAWRADASGIDVEGLWLGVFGTGVWFVGQLRFRLHKERWRSRLLRWLDDNVRVRSVPAVQQS